MNIEQQLACVHPMLYESELNSEKIYSIGGTGFLVSYGSRVYLITARHCLENNKYMPEQVSILLYPGSRSFVPFDVICFAKADEPEEQDYADFVILRMKTEMVSHEDRLQMTHFVLTDATIAQPSKDFDAFVARGFPTELNVPDYAACSIERHSLTFQATFVGKADENHTYLFTWPKKSTLSSPDGLSGSPLFGLQKESDSKYRMCLTCMIIRGDKTSLQCIDASVLWKAFKFLER